jgi:outer membrane receptor protein involved in Fe transport
LEDILFKAISYIGTIMIVLAMFVTAGIKAQIAPGVQQSAAQTATITGTVIRNDGTPVSGADVRLSGPSARLVTTSDAHGTFVFTSVPYGSYRIDVTGLNLGTVSRDDVIVKGDITVAIQYVAETAGGLKEIARVSTRSAGAQINTTPANIASINPSDYAFQGNASWRQLLDRIPGVTVGGDLLHGISTNDIIPDSPFQPIVLSINGALPYETSTTLDGMPLQNTSFSASAGGGVDLSALPMTAFDTADVVRGPGANAPSILDSIGGSFVLHAPGRVEKNQAAFSVSNDPYSGVVSNMKIALRFGRFSAALVYGINTSPGPLGTQNVLPGNTAQPLTVNGQPFLACTGPIPYTCSNPFTENPTPQYTSCDCLRQDALLICCLPVDTGWAQHNGAIALSYDLTPSVTAQVFYAGSSANMQQPLWNALVDFTPGSGYAGSIAPGLHTYIGADGALAILQSSSLLEEKLTANVGHGVLRLAALQNNTYATQSISYNPPNGTYTLWGTGYYGTSQPGTPVTFNGTSADVTFGPCTYTLSSWVNNRDLLASYAMQIGSASRVGLSYVSSYYNAPYMCDFGGFFFGNQPVGVSETTQEFRLNAGTELSDKLSLDASWYVVRGLYHVQNPADSTGNTYTNSAFPYSAPRLGVVWHAGRDIAIRLAAGGGYALPQLSQLVGTNSTPNCSSGTYCAVSLENLNLMPEKSFGFDIGTDMRLHRDTTLSFDLYRTNVFGQFFSSVNLTGTFNGLPLYTTQYNNLAQSRYEGINVDIHHETPKGLYWHGAFGLTRAYVVNVPAGFYDTPGTTCDRTSGAGCQNTYIIPGINFDGEFQSTVPYATGSAQIGYRWTPGRYVDIAPTYYGNNNSYFRPAFVEFDAHAGYALTRNISLFATFRNITNAYGQNYEFLLPTLGAPVVAGAPSPVYGLPFGPRSIVVTANFTY